MSAGTLTTTGFGDISQDSLQVGGDARAGDPTVVTTQGSRIVLVLAGTVSIDLPSIAAGASGSGTGTITGALSGDIIVIIPPNTINADLVYQGAAITAADTVTVTVSNEGAGAVDEGALSFNYILVRVSN